jgi:porin
LNQEIEPQYWSAGLILRDSFRAGDLAGVAMGQPLITSVVGDATQTNFELFYNFPVNRNLRITPLLQVITHPGNRQANDTVVSGTIRTVFSF